MASKSEINCVHLAGEFFVAAELSKRGFAVAITMGNAKAIDVLAEKDGKSYMVQVKTSQDKKKGGWFAPKKILQDAIYVFVWLNNSDTPPDYFIFTAQELERLCKTGASGISGLSPSTADTTDYRDRWDKIVKTTPILPAKQ